MRAFENSWRYVILIKLGQHEVAVAVKQGECCAPNAIAFSILRAISSILTDFR